MITYKALHNILPLPCATPLASAPAEDFLCRFAKVLGWREALQSVYLDQFRPSSNGDLMVIEPTQMVI